MSKEIQIFKNEKLNLQARAIQNEDGSISIDIEDTAKGFGWTRIAQSGNEVIRWDRINKYISELGSYPQVGTGDFIPESLFYLLAMKANNKVAQEFQKWLAVEVIPQIRKHGAYMTDDTIEKALASPDFLIQLATNLKEEKEKRRLLEEEKKANAPKVIFADAVSASRTSILVGELAKLMKQNGIDTGEKRLFNWLRENGYLVKRKGTDYNMPTQKSLELGVIETKERTINNPDGSIRITKTPKVTGKGQQYFINKFIDMVS